MSWLGFDLAQQGAAYILNLKILYEGVCMPMQPLAASQVQQELFRSFHDWGLWVSFLSMTLYNGMTDVLED